ncbi:MULTISPECIES: LysR family transcriptional regulator [Variovorax]|uniref:LysR family transcriptional regulator n=1 Tax=Variovorax TaxID=34072 RepID=UPI002860B07C|nr:LysR family transcriptional regulator [Variovorax sp. 3319]MDR6890784.1 DNA-binding transcriptional LysR family regulator [Variovorax sp. 3319]
MPIPDFFASAVHKLPDQHIPSAQASSALDDVRFFLAVAREGSLSSAARALKVEHSTVARRVGALEASLGVRLFDRLQRSWTLTSEGEALVAPAERLELEALAFTRAATSATSLHGTVRISAPPVFVSQFLVPHLAGIADRWKGIDLDLVGEVRTANLHRREADLSLRFMRPDEPGLAARKLGELSFRLYGAPTWLSRAESEWSFVGYGDALNEVPHQQLLARIAGERPFVLRSNDLAAVHQACRAGMGLAMLPSFLARTDDALIEVPGADRHMLREIWCVVHPDVRRSPRVRLMVDLIGELIQGSSAALV